MVGTCGLTWSFQVPWISTYEVPMEDGRIYLTFIFIYLFYFIYLCSIPR